MFQRFKGVLDARIAEVAEETAKQRSSASTSPARSASTPRRSSSRNLSPSKRPAKSKDADNGSKAAPVGKGPDPSEFDPEFVIGEEDDQSNRSGTPQPKEKADMADNTASDGQEKAEDGQAATADGKASTPPKIPADVQVRLRKLDKLEPKYSELLRSYRIAHARISAIEAFESSLREHTPLTSINDPPSFVEYLGQLNVKSDMLMEELKRVTKERNEFNKKLEDAEKRATEASEEVEKLQAQAAAASGEASNDDSATLTESIAPISPSKASKETENTEDTEDFFSYDSELPRVQSQLRESEQKTDLSVAEQLATSRFKDLTDMRDILQKAQPELLSLRKDVTELRSTKEELSTKATEYWTKMATSKHSMRKSSRRRHRGLP
ncbi:hypothetical protein BDV95DRAFT_33316 [Massariosphaeria phaeospora]|uniref:Uncharacterized protein n=1 Tax=Massariosphaeria phaeospora TaxID=100035 RepID=A0A7C8ML78_9PLEO|nr:hypothetical protein BDV95DRAFT_33316 [Massariosphaeria phaeospora]